MNQTNIINHSSYYDVDTFSTLADRTKDCFTVLKGHCIEFKYYADGIHSGLTPPVEQ